MTGIMLGILAAVILYCTGVLMECLDLITAELKEIARQLTEIRFKE